MPHTKLIPRNPGEFGASIARVEYRVMLLSEQLAAATAAIRQDNAEMARWRDRVETQIRDRQTEMLRRQARIEQLLLLLLPRCACRRAVIPEHQVVPLRPPPARP